MLMCKVLAARLRDPLTAAALLGLLFRAAQGTVLGAAGGVCCWERVQDSHRGSAGRGSGHGDLGLPIRRWGVTLC